MPMQRIVLKFRAALFTLLLLSHLSHVRLCATPQTAAHQAPPSLGFSRQEHWSGLPFPSPMHESESEVAQSRLTLSHPMDCSLPGSSVHGIFQARVLELGAIAFSIIHTSNCQKLGQTQHSSINEGNNYQWYILMMKYDSTVAQMFSRGLCYARESRHKRLYSPFR